jgi:hypothetical protein
MQNGGAKISQASTEHLQAGRSVGKIDGSSRPVAVLRIVDLADADGLKPVVANCDLASKNRLFANVDQLTDLSQLLPIADVASAENLGPKRDNGGVAACCPFLFLELIRK